MKVAECIKTSSKTPLTESEKQHMAQVQEAIDEGVYNTPKPKGKRIRNAVEKALRKPQ